jgi:hypothetical protein
LTDENAQNAYGHSRVAFVSVLIVLGGPVQILFNPVTFPISMNDATLRGLRGAFNLDSEVEVKNLGVDR